MGKQCSDSVRMCQQLVPQGELLWLEGGRSVNTNDFIVVAKRVYDLRLTYGCSGNLSMRTEGGFWITPTGSCLGSIDAHELSWVSADGSNLCGQPSREYPLHLALYADPGRPVGAVLHFHGPWTRLVADASGIVWTPRCALPELRSLGPCGSIPVIEHADPGSDALVEAVMLARGEYAANAALLRGHGALVWGSDVWDVLYQAEALEHAAMLHYHATRGAEDRC